MGCINSDLANSGQKRSNQSTLEKKIVLNSQVKQIDSFLISPTIEVKIYIFSKNKLNLFLLNIYFLEY